MVSLKQFIHSEAYRDFLELLDKKIGSLHVSMESARSLEAVLSLQGQIFALRKLKSLREELIER